MRRLKAERSVRPVTIVMLDEDSKDILEMLFVQDQQPVETLGANRAYEALRHRVRLWGQKRRANDLAAGAAKHLVKTVRKLLVPIAGQVADRFWPLAQTPCQLSGLLGYPFGGRSRRAASHMHAPATEFGEEKDVEPLQPDRLHREEVDSEQASPMRSQKLAPRHPATPAG